uniref:Reverse transcriptase domain-containing protein n=1 Tax=Eptatretus burgeri TaxID=7764 RepID=A0A8C4WQT9_EPTBU
MESTITIDMKSFLFSINLISDYQFGFRQGHSNMDMLLLLTQQWMEALNIRHTIRDLSLSLDISHAFDTVVWHPVLVSNLSSYGIQGQLHTWLNDFLHSHSQRVALNGIFSSPLLVKAGVSHGSVLSLVLFLIFINDLSKSLESLLYLSADEFTLCTDTPHPSDRQAAASSLSSDLDKDHKMAKHLTMSFTPAKYHTLTIPLRKERLANFPMHFINKPLDMSNFSHSNSWDSLSAMIFIGQTTFQSWLQSQPPNGHPPSYKALPWYTETPIQLQDLHSQLDGGLLPTLGWLRFLTPCSA